MYQSDANPRPPAGAKDEVPAQRESDRMMLDMFTKDLTVTEYYVPPMAQGTPHGLGGPTPCLDEGWGCPGEFWLRATPSTAHPKNVRGPIRVW